MPQLTFSAGKVLLLYYDTRLDHTEGIFTPYDPFAPDALGRFYRESREPRGELPAEPGRVFGSFVDDAGLALRRHTIDLRVAQANAGAAPTFSSARVSQYRFGTRGDESGTIAALRQLQVNPPNLPLFARGTTPFLGDYVDIAGSTFAPPSTPGGPWTFNTGASEAPVHYATWTSNQDVRPPVDGDWTRYTPVGGGGASRFDPTQNTPACVSGREGMRNQNIYSSRITQGLLVSSPQNTKPLSPTLVRAFVVEVRNATPIARSFRLTIPDQPVGGKASFVKFPATDPPTTTLDVATAPHSAVARAVFATSTDPAARIRVEAVEIQAPGGAPVPSGLSSFVLLNPDPTTPPLTNPDGGGGGDIATIEIYAPNISNPNISNPNISNPNVSNPNISNPNVSNPNVSNPNVSNPDIADPNISNPNVSNPNISNPNISNPNISNPNISNQPVSDVTYVATNTGNTTASYHVKLVGTAPGGVQLQLLLNKTYGTPLGLGCALREETHETLLAAINEPLVESPTGLNDPNIPDPRPSNATFWLRPGETALITLRGFVDLTAMRDVSTRIIPVLVPHPADPNGSGQYVAPLFVTLEALPAAQVGQPYSATLAAIGGTAPYTWTASGLPSGLALSPTGALSGTPTTAGTFGVTVQVTDASTPARVAQKNIGLTIAQAATTTTLASAPNPSTFGQTVTLTATVAPTTGTGTPTGTVTFAEGTTTLGTTALSGGVVTLTISSLAVGSHSITATYGGDSNFFGGTSTPISQSVGRSSTSTTLTSAPNPATLGQTVTFTAQVTASAAGPPTGSVTFRDGATVLGSAALQNGTATFSTAGLTAGSHAIQAAYAGDVSFAPSASAILTQTITAPVFYNFTGFFTPLTTAGTLGSPTFSGSFLLGRGVPIKWQLRDANGVIINRLSTLASLDAVFNTDCAGTPEGPSIRLYAPTTGATGGSTFRFGTNQYIFNWDTSTGVPTGRGCYSLVVQLDDGSAPKVTIVNLR
jgi:hypothetical protein